MKCGITAQTSNFTLKLRNKKKKKSNNPTFKSHWCIHTSNIHHWRKNHTCWGNHHNSNSTKSKVRDSEHIIVSAQLSILRLPNVVTTCFAIQSSNMLTIITLSICITILWTYDQITNLYALIILNELTKFNVNNTNMIKCVFYKSETKTHAYIFTNSSETHWGHSTVKKKKTSLLRNVEAFSKN